jgi:hypothetical protein
MVVSSNVLTDGVNIPASDIIHNLPNDTTSDQNFISWGDGNNNMSHYLSVLATELWLLKNNGQDYSITLKELYYAMLALERLDGYSEEKIRWKQVLGPGDNGTKWSDSWMETNYIKDNDINGFALRNDVTPDFWRYYHGNLNKFNVANFSSNFSIDNKEHFMEENSQDVIEHTLEGLALVSKLTGTESVANIPCSFYNALNYQGDLYIQSYLQQKGIMNMSNVTFPYTPTPQTINFSLWAKDIVKRYISYMQNGYRLPGTSLSKCLTQLLGINIGCISTKWILLNPVTDAYVQEGSGDNFGVAAASSGIIRAGIDITGEDLRINDGYHDNSLSDDTYNYVFKFPTTFIDWVLQNLNVKYDDDLTRSLACTGNILRDTTLLYLRSLSYNNNPNNAQSRTVYEHLPIMNLALHYTNQYWDPGNAVYNYDKIMYEDLLNSAPVDGPATNCGVLDWTSTSRCRWPQNLGKPCNGQTTPASYAEFNGLDYMMLHNLYYMAFRREDFGGSLSITCNTIPQLLKSQYAHDITANCIILGNNVTYRAGNQIHLTNGFRASSLGGKTFRAKVIPHTNYVGTAYVMPTGYTPTYHSKKKSGDEEEELIQSNIPADNNKISIYPNPCKGMFAVTMEYTDFPVQYSITNASGAVVFSGQITSNRQLLNISDFAKGVYIIRLSFKERTVTQKIVLM